jgi:hypothetical protein
MQDRRLGENMRVRPEDARQAGMAQTILNSVHRLKQVLDEENRLLEGGKSADHQPFIDKKNQILRELLALQSTRRHFPTSPGFSPPPPPRMIQTEPIRATAVRHSPQCSSISQRAL